MRDILTMLMPVPGITGITISDDCITVVRIQRDQHDTPALTACTQRRFFGPFELDNALKTLSKELRLKRAYCTTLLPDDNYKLLLTETPEVPEKELLSALRWQVKDLIEQPVDETTFEIFPAPKASALSTPDSVYVLTAANETIQQRVDLLAAAEINLQCIDIPEMALRNISMLLPETEQGVVMLWLNNSVGTLIIIRRGEIHFTRNINLGLDQLSDQLSRDNNSDMMILEIQRSLDYYESHFNTDPIHHIRLAPGIITAAPWLPDVIKQTLDLETREIELEKYINQHTDTGADLAADYFITIGAALRHEAATP